METLLIAIATAVWLGILTSISPCPLATNIAAISFIGRRVDSTRFVLFAGLFYTLGRTLTYLVLGIFLVKSLLAAPYLSQVLQKYMNMLLGPILILVGMVLLELINPRVGGFTISERMQKRATGWGLGGALLLGIVFALSFCPTSAALFFGSLIPLAVKSESSVMLPFVYGAGTGLPVLLFALLIAFSAQSLGKFFNKLTQFEFWARRVTGVLFIIIGIYYTLVYVFGIFD